MINFFIKDSSETAPHLDEGKIVHTQQHKDAIAKYCELGVPGLGASFVCGGTQTPLHVAALGRVPFAVANIGLAGGYATMTEAVIRMLPNYPNIKNSETLVHDMAQGLAHGAVCLAENHSHSSVTDIR
jgi:alkylation response protein AidB-like acyl-CoA dehydrogenase